MDEAVKMKHYVGSRDYKPDGFVTVDVDADRHPDIVASVTALTGVADDSVGEIVAGHVLEHIEWPESFLAFCEFTRVLKIGGRLRIAVPDMTAMLGMLGSGESAFRAMGLIYGLGARDNPFEQHRYGFTANMLIDILETLGFGKFNWWNSAFADGSNGWTPMSDGKSAISLNVEAEKLTKVDIDLAGLHARLVGEPLRDFLDVAARHLGSSATGAGASPSARLYQRIHFQLIDAQQRIRYLESLLAAGTAP
jgi:predicted SAM-dependent methyltransferase